MNTYIALLRAVNVGGTGKLPMADLTRLCVGAGFTQVKTYIASGNVVFKSTLNGKKAKALLEARLLAYAGKQVAVLMRNAADMAAVLANNPFADAEPNRVVAIFLDAAPDADILSKVTGQRLEKIALGQQEIYVYYGQGMADTKLSTPVAKAGTARNMNTVAKLAKMAAKIH